MIASIVWMARKIARALASRDGTPVSQAIDEHRHELKRVNDMIERLLSSR